MDWGAGLGGRETLHVAQALFRIVRMVHAAGSGRARVVGARASLQQVGTPWSSVARGVPALEWRAPSITSRKYVSRLWTEPQEMAPSPHGCGGIGVAPRFLAVV